ncbi:DNA-binding response regulator [Paenibacillus montaniterrae]|uniref:DNA-binding response regulator n=1 Tax=Paenibacillus montaniterrae TaxID=429341 RepID=A0A919YNZ4_9BACL|nr:response regulator transcription factor [Paenibacillus montaniterrae]GIP15616.1 DNA-binding response regulator [Paenibacillus montaniterrae]
MEQVIEIMIVDDHDMVRLGLKTYLMLEPSFRVVAEASNGREAIQYLQGCEKLPDLILMDLMMPEMNGIEATKAICAAHPSVKIVMLTSFLEDEKVYHSIEAGAISYVLKTVSAEELIFALKGALKGMPVMTTEVSQSLTRGLRVQRTQQGDETFTEREREVLLLVADGLSNKEIADELHISIKTVKTHVSNLLMKCELEDRTQLAVLAHRKGWANK